MIDPLATWKSELKKLEPIDSADWAIKFAQFVADRVPMAELDAKVMTATGLFSFTFNQALFASGLFPILPSPSAPPVILQFANAWEAAVLASVAVSTPGIAFNPATPATIFSAVISTTVDIPSVAIGKLKIMELAYIKVDKDTDGSEFAEKFRDAFLSLTFTVSGINTITPTPTPFIAPFVPLT